MLVACGTWVPLEHSPASVLIKVDIYWAVIAHHYSPLLTGEQLTVNYILCTIKINLVNFFLHSIQSLMISLEK